MLSLIFVDMRCIRIIFFPFEKYFLCETRVSYYSLIQDFSVSLTFLPSVDEDVMNIYSFCTGDLLIPYSNDTNAVAIVCGSSKIWYRDMDLGSGNGPVHRATALRIFLMLSLILDFISSVLLLATAAIYYMQSNLRDTLGSCYFYFCLTLGIAHSNFTYMQIFHDGLLPDFCLTNSNLQIL